MTIQEVIERVDELCPNQYSEEQKTRWLRDFDKKTYIENAGQTCGRCASLRASYESDGTDDLWIPEPYADSIYCNWLMARIAEANAETARYNMYATLHDDAMHAFLAHLAATTSAPSVGRWRF